MDSTLYLVPASLDIEAWQGDPLAVELTVMKADGTGPMSLAGYSGAMQVRTSVADQGPVEATAVVSIVNAAGGVLSAVIDKTQMAGLSGRYRYDLQIVDASSQPQTLIAGALMVRQEVTR